MRRKCSTATTDKLCPHNLLKNHTAIVLRYKYSSSSSASYDTLHNVLLFIRYKKRVSPPSFLFFFFPSSSFSAGAVDVHTTYCRDGEVTTARCTTHTTTMST